MLFAETNWPLYGFAFGVALAVGILMRRSRKYFSARARWQREQQSNPAAMIEPVKRTAAPTNLDKPGSVQRWEVEMHEIARELMAQMDSKMVALQHLIRDAEAAAARLEAANAATKKSDAVPSGSFAPRRDPFVPRGGNL